MDNKFKPGDLIENLIIGTWYIILEHDSFYVSDQMCIEQGLSWMCLYIKSGDFIYHGQ
jgi:hypothetical protein